MHVATHQLNYAGVFVYQRGVQLDSMRLVHEFDGQRERERLLSLSGPAREVIRDGKIVTCYFANDKAVMVEQNPPRDMLGIGLSAPLEVLQQSYHFTRQERDRVAGRTAVIVAVTPKSDDRYAYQLWIDEESKLLLKSVIMGGGRILEQVQFTHIEVLDEIAAELLLPQISGSGFTWQTDQEETTAGAQVERVPAWRVGWIPNGFALKQDNIQNMATSQMPVEHLVFSDGMAMVSIFIEKLMPEEPHLQGYSARGAVNAFSRVADQHQVTVVGELPLAIVKQIAVSVARIEN